MRKRAGHSTNHCEILLGGLIHRLHPGCFHCGQCVSGASLTAKQQEEEKDFKFRVFCPFPPTLRWN